MARKQFTMTEAVAIAEAMKAAEEAEGDGSHAGRVKPPADFAEGTRRTRDKVAVATG